MIYEPVRTLLLGSSAIATAVGPRVYSKRMPDNPTNPSIVIHVVGGSHLGSLTGSSGLAVQSLQIDCYSASLSAAWAIAELVRLRCQDFRGVSAGLTIKGFTDWQDEELDDPDIDIYCVSCLCRLWHSEAKPA